jgi:hypothetical protein
MVRKYVAKRRPWRDKNRRMARVVELRAAGLSLRRIAAQLVVDEKTVRNDLARWERERPNVTQLRNANAESRPTGGTSPHPDSASTGTVTPIRRIS